MKTRCVLLLALALLILWLTTEGTVWFLSWWDPKLGKALVQSCSTTERPTTKEHLTALADYWLKFRNSAEQRVDWYYVALLAGLAALMSGYEKLQKGIPTGRVLFMMLGAGGAFAGFWIFYSTLYDVGKLNLVGRVLECSTYSKHLGLEGGRYTMGPGIAQGAFVAGILFFSLMSLFAWRLVPATNSQSPPQG